MAKAPRFGGLTPDLPLGEAARSILRQLFDAALAEAPGVLNDHDARATHDMRVALRRLRSGLDAFEHEFPRAPLRLERHALRRLARRLGEVRDADVHLARLRGALAGATAAEAPGIGYAIEASIAQRRSGLAAFAIELSQFDRERFGALLSSDADA
jgi:CHAD domain-containing protein